MKRLMLKRVISAYFLVKCSDKCSSAVVWKEIKQPDLHLKCDQDLQAGWGFAISFNSREWKRMKPAKLTVPIVKPC